MNVYGIQKSSKSHLKERFRGGKANSFTLCEVACVKNKLYELFLAKFCGLCITIEQLKMFLCIVVDFFFIKYLWFDTFLPSCIILNLVYKIVVPKLTLHTVESVISSSLPNLATWIMIKRNLEFY